MKQLPILKLFLLLFCITVSSVNAASLSIDVDPMNAGIDNTLSVIDGSSFDVTILINNVTNLTDFQFTLNFDSAILNATSIVSEFIFGSNPIFDYFEVANAINVSTATLAESSLFATKTYIVPSVLATISFDAIGSGLTALSLTSTSTILLSDFSTTPISPLTLNGADVTVTASPSAVPIPGALVLMLSGLSVLGFRKRITTS